MADVLRSLRSRHPRLLLIVLVGLGLFLAYELIVTAFLLGAAHPFGSPPRVGR